jgi:hypothetical protein
MNCHMDAPATSGDVVERRPELRQMQRMPWAAQDGGNRQYALRHRGQRAHRDETVESLSVEDTAIAAFRKPLREWQTLNQRHRPTPPDDLGVGTRLGGESAFVVFHRSFTVCHFVKKLIDRFFI